MLHIHVHIVGECQEHVFPDLFKPITATSTSENNWIADWNGSSP